MIRLIKELFKLTKLLFSILKDVLKALVNLIIWANSELKTARPDIDEILAKVPTKAKETEKEEVKEP